MSIIYGGSAGPGLFTQLGPAVVGLFRGRLAHEPAEVDAKATWLLAITRWLGLGLAVAWNLLVALPVAVVRWFV